MTDGYAYANRDARIKEETLPVWRKVTMLTRQHQKDRFYWPDFVQLDEADMKVLVDAYGYVPAKFAGVALAPRTTFVGRL